MFSRPPHVNNEHSLSKPSQITVDCKSVNFLLNSLHRKSLVLSLYISSLVYDLRTQNLSFVSPISEQIGTTTMHFPEMQGGSVFSCKQLHSYEVYLKALEGTLKKLGFVCMAHMCLYKYQFFKPGWGRLHVPATTYSVNQVGGLHEPKGPSQKFNIASKRKFIAKGVGVKRLVHTFLTCLAIHLILRFCKSVNIQFQRTSGFLLEGATEKWS